MTRLRIVHGEDKTDVEVPDEMLTATDEQLRGYVVEELHRELPDEMVIERTSEAIIIHPKATYG